MGRRTAGFLTGMVVSPTQRKQQFLTKLASGKRRLIKCYMLKTYSIRQWVLQLLVSSGRLEPWVWTRLYVNIGEVKEEGLRNLRQAEEVTSVTACCKLCF